MNLENLGSLIGSQFDSNLQYLQDQPPILEVNQVHTFSLIHLHAPSRPEGKSLIMTGTGLVYKDLLPVPDDTQPVSEPGKREVSHSLRQEPTASHALATADVVGGVVSKNHGQEVRDLGWNEPKEQIPAPLVGGMENEELWVLVRRFNKVSYNTSKHSTRSH